MKAGFHPIGMAEEDEEKPEFSATDGYFEYIRMSFGLNNAPPTLKQTLKESRVQMETNSKRDTRSTFLHFQKAMNNFNKKTKGVLCLSPNET